MSDVTPVVKELITRKTIEDARMAIIRQLEAAGGKIIKSDEAYIECDFGSLLLSRIIGEFWVPRNMLPKKAEIHLEPTENNGTKVKILIRDTHKYGIILGYVKKYENALQDVADSVLSAIK